LVELSFFSFKIIDGRIGRRRIGNLLKLQCGKIYVGTADTRIQIRVRIITGRDPCNERRQAVRTVPIGMEQE